MSKTYREEELVSLGIVHRKPDVLHYLNPNMNWQKQHSPLGGGHHSFNDLTNAGISVPDSAGESDKRYIITNSRPGFSYINTPCLEEATAALAALMWLGYPVASLLEVTKLSTIRLWFSGTQDADKKYSKIVGEVNEAFNASWKLFCMEAISVQTMGTGDYTLSSSTGTSEKPINWCYTICDNIIEAKVNFVQLNLRGRLVETIGIITGEPHTGSYGVEKVYRRSQEIRKSTEMYRRRYDVAQGSDGVSMDIIERQLSTISEDNEGYGSW